MLKSEVVFAKNAFLLVAGTLRSISMSLCRHYLPGTSRIESMSLCDFFVNSLR